MSDICLQRIVSVVGSTDIFWRLKTCFASFEAKSAPVLKRTLSPKVLKHFQCYQIFLANFAISFHNMHHFWLNFATFSVTSREFGPYHGILLSTLVQSSPAMHICIIITRRMLRYARVFMEKKFSWKKNSIFFVFCNLYFEIPYPIWGLPAKIWGSRPVGLAVKGI
jgi:hypothetical protein